MFDDKATLNGGVGGRVVFDTSEIKGFRRTDNDSYLEVELADGRTFETVCSCPSPPVPEFMNDGSFSTIVELLPYVFPTINTSLAWNTLTDRPMMDHRLIGERGFKDYMGKVDLLCIQNIFENDHRLMRVNRFGNTVRVNCPKAVLNDALLFLAHNNPINPFIDRIERHDGMEVPIDNFLQDIGCSSLIRDADKDGLYLRWLSRAMFLAPLERQLDNSRPIHFVPIILGDQGSGKSTLCRRLGMDQWHRNTAKPFTDDRVLLESAYGSVICEMNECVQLKMGVSAEHVKAFMDKTCVQYRKAYAAEESQQPISFILFGTTNDMEILTDVTGNRRFFPVYLYSEGHALGTERVCDISRYSEWDILNLWRSALEEYRKGCRWDDGLDVDSAEGGIRDLVEIVRDGAMQSNTGVEELKEYLDSRYPNIGDVVARKELEDFLISTNLDSKDIKEVMMIVGKCPDAFGFSSKRPGGGRIRIRYNGPQVPGLIRIR